mgnify:CR=1 FL=1
MNKKRIKKNFSSTYKSNIWKKKKKRWYVKSQISFHNNEKGSRNNNYLKDKKNTLT